jgi:thiol-disulfide isomerase/thioredoxin
VSTQPQFKIDKSQFKKAPEFTQITGYINTPGPIKIADLKGKVVLVHFWTYTCTNCIHTIPYLNDWYQKYSNKGLVIVSIHRPEFEFEKNIDNLKAAVQQYEIKYPVLQDNNYGTWNAYGNTYWPRDYLIDNQGLIRYNHVCEGGYDQTEKTIQSLLAEGVS